MLDRKPLTNSHQDVVNEDQSLRSQNEIRIFLSNEDSRAKKIVAQAQAFGIPVVVTNVYRESINPRILIKILQDANQDLGALTGQEKSSDQFLSELNRGGKQQFDKNLIVNPIASYKGETHAIDSASDLLKWISKK